MKYVFFITTNSVRIFGVKKLKYSTIVSFGKYSFVANLKSNAFSGKELGRDL